MANKSIVTTQLDFDSIKQNLKTYLQGQSEFSDYDFDGSGLSILLDVLAYNTHYNALYTNLAINEAFIDSASKRSSVVSKAKELGYVARSAVCSRATLTLTVNATGLTPPLYLTLPKYSPFTTSVDNKVYTFYTQQDYVVPNINDIFTFSEIQVLEGTPLTYKYTAAEGIKYVIPNDSVDLSTLRVQVQESIGSSNFTTFSRNTNFTSIDGTDTVYFVKEIEGQLYELEFGNDVIGKALENGNIIHFDYMICNKDEPNGAKVFTYQGGSLLGVTPQITTITKAILGSDIETIESVRYNAPRAYSAQDRGVTVEDYKTLIKNNYPDVESISIWGGEDNTPPVYGKVFISVKPLNDLYLTQDQKDYIATKIIRPRAVLSVLPEFVDATYLNLELAVSVYYDPNATSNTSNDIASIVTNAIMNYNNNELEQFDGVFKYSKASRIIDASEQSIKSSIMTLKVHREVKPVYDTATQYTVNLVNPIYNSEVPEESIISTGFYYPGSDSVVYIDDLPLTEEEGILRIFQLTNNVKNYIETVGTVSYNTGVFEINGLTITDIEGSAFKFIIKTQSNDVVSVRNQIVSIDSSLLTVTPIVDTSAANYKFTSSRN